MFANCVASKLVCLMNSLTVEFFVKKIKAQADLQFVKIFGDCINKSAKHPN